jgi:hypothetical protein
MKKRAGIVRYQPSTSPKVESLKPKVSSYHFTAVPTPMIRPCTMLFGFSYAPVEIA